jgi:hypothetical protein
MTERTKNVYKRQLISFNPNFRIDSANPQMGGSGTDVYKIYGVTDDGETQSSISLSSGGNFEIFNDRKITICGGTDHNGNEEDVIIIGKNGNVSITANGMVRIRATSIMLEADEDIHLKAGRNVDISSGSGRTLLQGTQIDVSAPTGTLIEQLGGGFMKDVFEGSFVGLDFITSTLSSNSLLGGIAGTVLNKVI